MSKAAYILSKWRWCYQPPNSQRHLRPAHDRWSPQTTYISKYDPILQHILLTEYIPLLVLNTTSVFRVYAKNTRHCQPGLDVTTV